MKATQLFRDQLGLSQEVIAQYLCVTRSQLAMYEVGKRELSTAALAKLAEIALFFDQKNATEKVENKILKKQELEVKELLTHHAKELEYKQIKEQRLLDAIQKKHNQNLQLNSLALYLQKNKMGQAEVLLQQAITGIKKNGLARQAKQVLRLESIKSQLDYINILKEK
ncbi:MAG: helix-turn-helix transcriptional regulator [Flavobacterium sp.]|uniref:helix-turn-helix domain-containing protein n=1 Tax=Flavobacterium sp. TaxID=239 RepID=UPI002621B993|nr:helix-turn-helix transcriptional regulator [Flavobacterium sp.]MDD5151856.1 helix-turn-helix transcriptional regulator [Flavobacterium sp.]